MVDFYTMTKQKLLLLKLALLYYRDKGTELNIAGCKNVLPLDGHLLSRGRDLNPTSCTEHTWHPNGSNQSAKKKREFVTGCLFSEGIVLMQKIDYKKFSYTELLTTWFHKFPTRIPNFSEFFLIIANPKKWFICCWFCQLHR